MAGGILGHVEESRNFERRAFSAAGPVFLVVFGLVVLMTLAVLVLTGANVPGLVGLLVIGVTTLVVGLVWGAAQNRASTHEG